MLCVYSLIIGIILLDNTNENFQYDRSNLCKYVELGELFMMVNIVHCMI